MPLGQYVVAEAGFNWYLLDINIYSLPKKCMHYIAINARVTRRQPPAATSHTPHAAKQQPQEGRVDTRYAADALSRILDLGFP
jgi:hypothetical protein